MKPIRIAILTSQFNQEITNGLLSGALKTLEKASLARDQIQVFPAPGAYEIPLLAQEVAQSEKFDGVIALGCVIKGETAHFEYISDAVAHGLMATMLKTSVPISLGILTTYTWQQAVERSQEDSVENKGREAALACLQLIQSLKEIRTIS